MPGTPVPCKQYLLVFDSLFFPSTISSYPFSWSSIDLSSSNAPPKRQFLVGEGLRDLESRLKTMGMRHSYPFRVDDESRFHAKVYRPMEKSKKAENWYTTLSDVQNGLENKFNLTLYDEHIEPLLPAKYERKWRRMQSIIVDGVTVSCQVKGERVRMQSCFSPV